MNHKTMSNFSILLSVLGGIGMLATTYFAIKETKEFDEEELESCETTIEKVKTYSKGYKKTIGLGTATLLCMSGSKLLDFESKTSLIAGYELANRLYSEYRQGAIGVYGKDADDKIKDYVAISKIEHPEEDTVVYYPGGGVFRPDDEEKISDLLFYDEIADVYFETSLDHLKDCIYHLNRNFILRGGCAPYCELYDLLNLRNYIPPDRIKDLVWVANPDDNFGVQNPVTPEFLNKDDAENLWWSRGEGGYEWIDYYISKVESEDSDPDFRPIYRLVFPFAPEINEDY